MKYITLLLAIVIIAGCNKSEPSRDLNEYWDLVKNKEVEAPIEFKDESVEYLIKEEEFLDMMRVLPYGDNKAKIIKPSTQEAYELFEQRAETSAAKPAKELEQELHKIMMDCLCEASSVTRSKKLKTCPDKGVKEIKTIIIKGGENGTSFPD